MMLPGARFLLVPALLTALCHAPASAQERTYYAVRPGDRVTVEVFTAAGEKVDVVAGARVLDQDGDVYLPYVGTVHVAGLDESLIRQELIRLYSAFYDSPVINVKVELRVNVTGSVGRPGQYFLDPTATIIDALSEAGGASSELAVNSYQIPADQSQVRLVRDGQTMTLDVRPDHVTDEIIQMRVRSGDWIHVPARSRSRVRDEVMFWGSVTSFLTSVVALIVLIGK